MKKPIAYVAGWKESTSGPDTKTLTLSFKSGVFSSFPKQHKNKKNFWCDEVFEGDTCALFLSFDTVLTCFNEALNESWCDAAFKAENYHRYKYAMPYPVNEDQAFALYTFSTLGLHLPYRQRYASLDQRADILYNVLKEYFPERTASEILALVDGSDIHLGHIYDQEIAEQVLSLSL